MLETRTRLQAAIPADRSASSKLVSFSRCFPTPLVRNILCGTNILVHQLLARSAAGYGTLAAVGKLPLYFRQLQAFERSKKLRKVSTDF